MARSAASPSTALGNALRSYETGGVTLGDVLEEIDRLLESGASAPDLLETLERREAVEPLASQAYVEILGVLNEAVERQSSEEDVAEDGGSEPPAHTDTIPILRPGRANGAPLHAPPAGPSAAESAAVVRVTALTSELAAARAALQTEQRRSQEVQNALTERLAASNAERTRTDEALRDSSHHQTEAQTLRDLLAARDESLATLMHSLGERDAQVAALRAEHSKMVSALEARARTGMQLEGDLQAARVRSEALMADLAAARTALESEQVRAQESARELADKIGSTDAARLHTEQVLRESERHQVEARTLRDVLTARDNELATLQQKHAVLLPALETRTQRTAQLEAELLAVSARAEASAVELTAARAALAAEQARADESAKTLVESTGSVAAAALRADDAAKAAARYEADAHRLRELVIARDAEIEDLRQEHSQALDSLEARTKAAAQLDSELKAVRLQAVAASAQLRTSQEAADELRGQLRAAKTRLDAFGNQLDAVAARAGGADGADGAGSAAATVAPAAEVIKLRSELAAIDAFVEKMRAPVDETPLQAVAAAGAAERAESERSAQLARLYAPQPSAPAQPPAPAATATSGDRAPASGALVTSTTAPLRPVPLSPFKTPLESGLLRAKDWLVTCLASGAAASRGAGAKPMDRARAVALLSLIFIAVLIGFLAHHSSDPTRPAVAAATTEPGSVIQDCATCPSMTVIPGGRFKQGSPSTDTAASAFEKPQHWVLISHPYAMSTNAVTVAEFKRFVTATNRDMRGCETYDGEWKHRRDFSWKDPGFDQTVMHPVTCVSWNDAEAYAQWLSTETGQQYRLPTASEWEYAALGGGDLPQPWGPKASDACAHANVADQSAAHRYPGWQVFGCDDGYTHTAPVGSFKANPFGLNDMLGNVFQWTADCWHADYVGAPIDGSARVDGDCGLRELRGGSWFSTPAYVRSNFRNHFAADYRTNTVGIRLVREMKP